MLLLGFGGWALLAQLSGAVIAQGQIVVDSRRQIIQHPDGGVVEEVLVRDAQLVERGELLLRLDGASLRTELQIVDSQLFEVLARMARFRAESANAREVAFGAELTRLAEGDAGVAEQIAGQRVLFETRIEGQEKQVEQQRKRIDQMLAQIDGLLEQASARRSQFDLLQSEVADQRSLHERGLTQKSRLLALEREAAEVRGEIGGLDAQVATIGEQIAGVELEILALDITRREEAAANVQDLAQTHAELAERRKDLLDRIGRLEVRAPSEGIVLGLQEMNEGAVLRAADYLMYLVPQDSPLLVEAQISPLQIDEVDIGQSARLVLPGFRS
nr:HlyD family type I secretion periplasmic adaptor subunit [Frigidibacter mobilis]